MSQNKFTVTFEKGPSQSQLNAKKIREAVFVNEQHIPTNLEFDELDAQAIHYVGYFDHFPVTTSRVLVNEHTHSANIQRVATLKAYRGQHLATALLKKIIQDCMTDSHLKQHVKSLNLNAQLPAQTFYEHFGFITTGNVFYEANLPHIHMTKSLN